MIRWGGGWGAVGSLRAAIRTRDVVPTGTAGVLRQITPTSTGGTDRSCGFGDWNQNERKASLAPRTGLFPGSSEAVFALCGDPRPDSGSQPRTFHVASQVGAGGLAGPFLSVLPAPTALAPSPQALPGTPFPLCPSPSPGHSLGSPCRQPLPGRPLRSLLRIHSHSPKAVPAVLCSCPRGGSPTPRLS